MATRIEAAREWAEVDVRDHLVVLMLGDETNPEGSGNYEFSMTPDEATMLAEQLMDGADQADKEYVDEEPTEPYRPLFAFLDEIRPRYLVRKVLEQIRGQMQATLGGGSNKETLDANMRVWIERLDRCALGLVDCQVFEAP